ncbi:hypothetical protein B7463_g11181, partial [Scytalidium lignicola]
MVELTVGDVAGLIALGIFIAQFLCPNLLLFVLAGLVKEKETAVTWYGQNLTPQTPTILTLYATKSNGVRSKLLWSTYSVSIIAALCAIAGIVTPLGLYSAFEYADSKTQPFTYVRDSSPYGVATPPRSTLPFSRTCSQMHGIFLQGPAPCPYSGTTVILSWNGSNYTYEMPYGYNTSVPQIVHDIYSSGTQDRQTSVSNFFDIQWRQWTLRRDEMKNNGSAFLVADYRPIESVILDNTIKPIEGLVVDTINGGIGFRNHTLPAGMKHGATWTEDLLFTEPQSSCVNLNLTMDFTVNINTTEENALSELNLVDRGAFYALNITYPYYDHDNAQNNPDLQGRAYKAAYLNNANSMAFLNVTNPNDSQYGNVSFSYINSYYGKKFPMSSAPLSLPLATTIFYLICAGAGSEDIANISNIYISCGLVWGAPQRVDGGSPFRFEGGSQWSSPLYSCASTLRATIKTVSFLLNGTADIENLSITGTRDKEYSDNSTIPLWGVEDSSLTYDGISPIWGIVDPAYEGYPNISLVRKPSLYLPGFSGQDQLTMEGVATGFYQYLPGSDFGPLAMNTAYSTSQSPTGITIDYSGYQNMAMFLKWLNLSATTEGAARILNLVWTDLAAGAVVGTKGVLGSGNAGLADETLIMAVAPIVNRIKYHPAFGIPAYILALVLILVALSSLVSAGMRKSSPAKLRTIMNHTSPGRIFTNILYPEKNHLAMQSKDWSQEYGKTEVDMNEIGQTLKLRSVTNSKEVVATEVDNQGNTGDK